MTHAFGPVPSRRLGQSLGIDPIPLKTCNWNCVYCQLGRTVPLTNELLEYVPVPDVLKDVDLLLQRHPAGGIDWVTFVGSGEPTLHRGLGEMILGVKRLTKIPVAVITNGGLLYRPEVRAALLAADAVLPTLDAGNSGLYRRINRPHPAITFERLVAGLSAFRSEFAGKLWIEVMLLRGMNDGEQELYEIADILQRVHPDEVHISLPTRPPAETWVQPADAGGLRRAMAILGTVARVVQPVAGAFEKGLQQDIVEAVVDIITRHPVSQQELQVILADWAPGELKHVLATLQASGKAQSVERYGRTFWTAGTSRFPSQAESRRTKPKPGSPRVRLSSAREMSGSAPATPKSMADPHDED